MNFKLGIIGAGVMANALLTQVIDKGVLVPEQMTIYDIDTVKCSSINSKINISNSINDLINNSEIILFAVKPQHYAEICEQNKFSDDKIILSIMAGVKISTLRKQLNCNCGILRIMPNMPCKVAKGMCALCFDNINQINKEFLCRCFSACGDIIEITEDKFDAVTSISGSGPAYVYMFIQGMIKGGIAGGLNYDESKKLAIATMIGGSELAKISTESLDTLVEKVCSKGGTTIEAVNVFRENGLEDIIARGVKACHDKSKELSEKL
jgi:pyrroline-5-carboxylate reductase